MEKNSPANAGDLRDVRLTPGPGRSLAQDTAPTAGCTLREPHGQRGLVGRGVGGKELDTTQVTAYTDLRTQPGTGKRTRRTGQGAGREAWSFYVFSERPPNTSARKLFELPSFRAFAEASLHRYACLKHWPPVERELSLQPLASPQRLVGVVGLKLPTF